MLYTRKGDSGTSGLFGTKERFSKDHPVYEALGTLDELNSLLGICRVYATGTVGDISLQDEIRSAQEALFIVQAELAGSNKHIDTTRVQGIEAVINKVEVLIGNPHAFVIPGATKLSAFLDYARTVARRAERSIVAPSVKQRVSDESLTYLNRLSSLLYALARYVAAEDDRKEASPSYS
ncbi:cob(I)yrinic acid a,c-diamide adenosyltransferase [Patescibacteria group bacterium]|nr:cob(I)yrinic acid a,c-diamide adenosyltransferase [Patescibacteria group bacterium]